MSDAEGRERERRVLEVFEAALDRTADERDAYVAAECAGDDALATEVRRLLALEGEAAPIDPLVSGVPSAPSRVGPYAILERIGTGGMGDVYLGERADGAFRRQVAIKRLRVGRDSAELLARFRRERQVQATLDHPGVAGLLDGGEDEEGVPYLVLEYVEGAPVDESCDARGLGTRERLELFLMICDAVEYAHRRGVIHRDLKPSNILVTADGAPKLLDFGIAKVLDDESFGPELLITQETFRMMTPAYASPEQLRFEPATEAADQYALGVILYQLLTGRLPFDLAGQSPVAIERIVTQDDPDPPSVARARSGETTRTTRRELEGDLDRIVLMALRKEPRRRYASVADLADDVQRHLDGRPVKARPDERLYRVVRFVRRNRLAVTLVGGIIVALAIGLAAALDQARVAQRSQKEATLERDDAEAVTTFLTEALAAAKPGGDVDREATVREMLDAAAARLDAGNFAGRPLVASRVHHTLGDTYSRLGAHEAGEHHLREAAALRRAELGPDDLRTCDTEILLTEVLKHRGKLAEGETLARSLVERLARLELADRYWYHRSLNALGGLLRTAERYDEAEDVFRRSLAGLVELRGPTSQDALSAGNNLALVIAQQGRTEEALPMMEECLDRTLLRFGPLHPDALNRRLNHAMMLRRVDPIGAIPTIKGLIDDGCHVNGPGHWETIIARGYLVGCLERSGELARALEVEEENLAAARAVLVRSDHQMLNRLAEVARLRFRRGRLEAALEAELVFLETAPSTEGYPESVIRNARFGLAQILMRLGRAAEARSVLEPLLDACEQDLGRGARKTRQIRWCLRDVCVAQGDFSSAAGLADEDLVLTRAGEEFETPAAVSRVASAAILHARAGHSDMAEGLLLEAHALAAERELPVDRRRRIAADLASFYEGAGDVERAAEWRRREGALAD